MQKLSDQQSRCLVYHALDPLAMLSPNVEHWLVDRLLHYQLVAEVRAPLEHIFALTNHNGCDWTRNREVVWIQPNIPLRSTSVGDVVFVCATGAAWMILSQGLRKIGTGYLGGTNMDLPNALALARHLCRTALYYRDEQGNKALVELHADAQTIVTVIVNGRFGSNWGLLHQHAIDLEHHWSLICPL
ncbi:MAG TPA: hypothetical protein VFA10_30210 [Ktedonobacteraceae bacterium]|nr:hypothetical protein [Ktedonobacteraceae bacterium]